MIDTAEDIKWTVPESGFTTYGETMYGIYEVSLAEDGLWEIRFMPYGVTVTSIGALPMMGACVSLEQAREWCALDLLENGYMTGDLVSPPDELLQVHEQEQLRLV